LCRAYLLSSGDFLTLEDRRPKGNLTMKVSATLPRSRSYRYLAAIGAAWMLSKWTQPTIGERGHHEGADQRPRSAQGGVRPKRNADVRTLFGERDDQHLIWRPGPMSIIDQSGCIIVLHLNLYGARNQPSTTALAARARGAPNNREGRLRARSGSDPALHRARPTTGIRRAARGKDCHREPLGGLYALMDMPCKSEAHSGAWFVCKTSSSAAVAARSYNPARAAMIAADRYCGTRGNSGP